MVSYKEWITIFTTYSRMMAAAQKAVEKEHPELFAGIVGRGNIVRLAAAKIVLPALRKWAQSSPGPKTPDEIRRAVAAAIGSIDDGALREAMREVYPDLTPDQLDNLVQAFHYMNSYVAQVAAA